MNRDAPAESNWNIGTCICTTMVFVVAVIATVGIFVISSTATDIANNTNLINQKTAVLANGVNNGMGNDGGALSPLMPLATTLIAWTAYKLGGN